MIDSGLASPPATSITYPHTDRLGTVVSVTGSTGAVTQRFTYDAYGRSSSAATGYPFRYTGQRFDAESGLMFYKARVYSTSLGRFLQTDPIGTKDDMNMYVYVGNDPVNATDPSGQSAWTKIGKFIWHGGDLGLTFAGMAEDVRTLGNSNASTWDRGLAALSLASEFAPVSLRDAREGAEFAEQSVRSLRSLCCFAAGTLVDTKNGLRPIEVIKVGDLVLARHEDTGETAYKPVSALIPKHDREVWEVTLKVSRSVQEKTGDVVVIRTTGDHPWRLETGVWVETAALGRGMRVSRAAGAAADVISVRSTGQLGAVYNLEVADFHTYFVGRERLWVHNTCWLPLSSAQKVELRSESRSMFVKKYGAGAMAGQEVHHRIPLEYSHLFGLEPNSIENLVALPQEIHKKVVNSAWNDFRRSYSDSGKVPTAAQIESFAQRVESWYAPYARNF